MDNEEKPQQAWVIEKTVGGYGVMKPADGSQNLKPTVIRPSTSADGSRHDA